MTATDPERRPAWLGVGKTEILWQEGDAESTTLREAWRRIFSEELPSDTPVDEWNGGDGVWKLFDGGRIAFVATGTGWCEIRRKHARVIPRRLT